MPTYIALLSLTEQGVTTIKEAPQRLQVARQAVESAGGRWISYYLTMGQYDAVATVELPNDEAAARVALATAMEGNVRTETMRAFPEEQIGDIVGGLP